MVCVNCICYKTTSGKVFNYCLLNELFTTHAAPSAANSQPFCCPVRSGPVRSGPARSHCNQKIASNWSACCSLQPYKQEAKTKDVTCDYFSLPFSKTATWSAIYWINSLKDSGHYIRVYRQFNIQQFYVLPTHCIYVFCVDLRTNSDYFPIQH